MRRRRRLRRADGAGDPNEPAACLAPAQAATYCAWTGGALPTPEQWVYAARGATVRSYPWGESSPGCDQHPDAIGCEAVPDRTRVVGAHPKGASPFGVQDVLLTSRELVRGAQGSAEPACGADGSFCAAAALVSPGRIDMVVPLAAPGDGTTTDSDVFGFRCAWEEK